MATEFGVTDLQLFVPTLQEGRCLVEIADATEISVRGRDAGDFLHRLCSADLRTIQPGEGLPAFFLDARGRAVALVDIYRLADGFEIASAPGQSGPILSHLQRYRIREAVTFEDLSDRRRHYRLFGRGAASRLQALFDPSPAEGDAVAGEHLLRNGGRSGDHGTLSVGGRLVTLRCILRGELEAFALVCDAADGDAVLRWMTERGVVPGPAPLWDAVRIELGLPDFGRDIGPDCLGPEVSPDPRAISTTKGCYLGQETVARLDAHGHLNRRLRGLRVRGEIPPPGTELLLRDKPVGRVTSAAYSPLRGEGVALAMIRREAWEPGTVVTWEKGEAVVTDLPMVDSQ